VHFNKYWKKAGVRMATEKEKFVLKSMEKLALSREQALALWDFDHEKAEDPKEVSDIEAKLSAEAKLAKKASSPINKVKNLKAKKKEDLSKENIIDLVEAFLGENAIAGQVLADVQKVTSTKFVFKDMNGDFYTLAITKNKKMPDGYKEA
jgi:hypothetical protein